MVENEPASAMDDLRIRVADNLAAVRERIAKAAVAAGRSPDEVTLVGVSKYVGAQQAAALVAAGCNDLGESRPQQLWERASELRTGEWGRSEVRWHLIGHLQRNKVARSLPLACCIHGVDSTRLLAALDAEAAKQHLRPRLLLEVNCSGDTEKHGLTPDAMVELASQLGDYRSVEVAGLMTMAARGGDLATAGRNFASLRQLRDQLQPLVPAGIKLQELSMGMTGDFEVAIAEGATMVRVGSALWEGVQRNR